MKTPTGITVVISAVQNIFGNIKLSQPPHVNVLPLLCESNTEKTLSLEGVEKVHYMSIYRTNKVNALGRGKGETTGCYVHASYAQAQKAKEKQGMQKCLFS